MMWKNKVARLAVLFAALIVYPIVGLALLTLASLHLILPVFVVGAAVAGMKKYLLGSAAGFLLLAVLDFLLVHFRFWSWLAWSRLRALLAPAGEDGQPKVARSLIFLTALLCAAILVRFNTYFTLSDLYGTAVAFRSSPTDQIRLIDKAIGAWRPRDGSERIGRLLASRGLVNAGFHQWEQARRDIDRAVLVDPRHAFPHVARASLYYVRGRPQQALKEYDSAIAAEPKDGIAHMGRGYELLQDKQLDRAIADLQIARCAKGTEKYCGAILALIGRAYDAKGDAVTAQSYYSQAAAEAGRLGLAGAFLPGAPDYVSRMVEIEGCMVLAPNEAGNFTGRAYLNLKLERNAQALADAKKAIALSPNNAVAEDAASIAAFELGDFKQALAEAQKAVQTAPDEAGYRLDEAVAQFRLGKKEEARSSWAAAFTRRVCFAQSVEAAEASGFYYPPASRRAFQDLLKEFVKK